MLVPIYAVILIVTGTIYLLFHLSLAKEEHHDHDYIDYNNLILIQDAFTEESSHFGFSFVLRNEILSGGNRSWIFIGAPKGNYGEDSDINREYEAPGVLWRCTLGLESEDTCEILSIDPSKAGGRDCRPVRCPNELKNNSGLGMTMVSDASRIVICAPEWKREESPGRGNYKINGLCHWLPTYVLEAEPFTMRTMIRDGFTSQRLHPFLDPYMQTVSRFPVWANGQAGFSSHISEDGSLYLGAPGVKGWNGSVVRYKDNWTEGSVEFERPNRIGQPEYARFSVLHTEFIENFYHLEYFGYSVTSGIFIRERHVATPHRHMAVGAPRGGLMKGIVLVFTYPEQITWLPEIGIPGDQYGSYFGSVLCAVDLNGDGMDELLIGAPLHNMNLILQGQGDEATRNRAIALQLNSVNTGKDIKVGDQGCVFVYSNKLELYNFGDPEILCGAQEAGSRFGSTIVALGDINGDGFNDVAIAAPFENDGEGAVYIYRGAQNFGLNLELPQLYAKISPSILKIKLMNFGLSIFGGLDVDDNETPDFAIGSHISHTVAIIRTRPYVKFEGRIDVYINETEAEKLPFESTGFVVRSCNRIRKGPKHESFGLTIKLSLDNRFHIEKSLEGLSYKPIGNSTVEYNIQMKLNQTLCFEWLAQAINAFDSDDSHPAPLTISQLLLYEEEFHDDENLDLIRHQMIIRGEDGQPTLNISGPGFHDFCSFCPPRTELMTSFQLPIATDNCMDDGNPICSPVIKIQLALRNGQSGISDDFIIGSGNVYTLKVKISNAETAETIYFPVVDILWSSPPLPEIPPDCKLNLTDMGNKPSPDVSLQCNLGYTIQHNETEQVEIKLYMHGKHAKKRKEELFFNISVYPSKEPAAVKTNQQLALSLEANVEVFIMGSSENVTFGNDTLTNVTQIYRVSVLGESPVENIRMRFWFPLWRNLNWKDRQIIYLSQPEESNCWGVSPTGNFLLETYSHLYESGTSLKSNAARLAGVKPKSEPSSRSSKFFTLPNDYWKNSLSKNNLNLYCESGDDSNCLQVECESVDIVPNHNIMLEFRLSIATDLAKNLLKENQQKSLHIQTIGFVQILDDAAKFTVSHTTLSEFAYVHIIIPVSPWIYFFSGLAGLLILILLILLLIKCGFFERPKKVKAELHTMIPEEPHQNWARWEYSQLYTPN